ncbi:MAG: flagellar FlbD family protein [Spirochaetaceae bacterium]|nr:flagellar FlbD family protein [Spirochaetaceae bacterium]
MITLTHMNGTEYYVNPHQIESIESKPDTTLLMLSGKVIIVREKPDEIVNKIIAYRRQIGGFGNEE